jgi:hypothetical protein
MFTARYGLSPYIKQIRFVFKGLTEEAVDTFSSATDCTQNLSTPAFLLSKICRFEKRASNTRSHCKFYIVAIPCR